MILYHATPYRNLVDITLDGIKKSYDGVYFADSAKAAAGFVALRGETQVAVIPVEFEENEVTESFDHNEAIFKNLLQLDSVKCFTYDQDVPTERLDLTKIQIFTRGQG